MYLSCRVVSGYYIMDLYHSLSLLSSGQQGELQKNLRVTSGEGGNFCELAAELLDEERVLSITINKRQMHP